MMHWIMWLASGASCWSDSLTHLWMWVTHHGLFGTTVKTCLIPKEMCFNLDTAIQTEAENNQTIQSILEQIKEFLTQPDYRRIAVWIRLVSVVYKRAFSINCCIVWALWNYPDLASSHSVSLRRSVWIRSRWKPFPKIARSQNHSTAPPPKSNTYTHI